MCENLAGTWNCVIIFPEQDEFEAKENKCVKKKKWMEEIPWKIAVRLSMQRSKLRYG